MKAPAVAALLLLLGSPAYGQDKLKAYFAAHDDEAKKKALDALEGAPVPKDPGARVRSLRDALALPAQAGNARIAEKPGESFVCTPRGYDAKKGYAAVISLHGSNGSGHDGLLPFCLPAEEWAERKAKIEADLKKEGQDLSRVTIKPWKLTVPWEDGLVLAPVYEGKPGAFEDSIAGLLAFLEQTNRTFAIDQDRVTVAGISLGAQVAIEIGAYHPDRFAGVLAVAGWANPEPWENLKPLQVFVMQGDKDPETPVANGRAFDEKLKAAGVTHVYREMPGMGHSWPKPDEGAKLRVWLRERVRQPWPRELSLEFRGEEKRRRVFWVELPAGHAAHVEAKAKDNEIDLTAAGPESLVLHLGEPLVDLEKEVVVRWGGKEVFRGKVERSMKELVSDLEGNGFDLPRAAPARVEVKAP
jgi:predicted esterase